MCDMENQRQSLGESVEAARIQKGWSKERAAQEAKISAITWKRIEDGQNVHDVKLAAALRVLGISGSGRSVAVAPAVDRDARIDQLRADLEAIRAELDRLQPPDVEESTA